MDTFKHILVATDFGDSSNRALDLALSMAAKFESSVTLLHSYMSPLAGCGYADGFVWPLDDLRRAADKELHAAIQDARARCPKLDGVLVYGEPWREILETARVRSAGLIVMGTHGRRGLARLLLGSVAEKVVRLSPVPVLTVADVRGQESKANAPVAELTANQSAREG